MSSEGFKNVPGVPEGWELVRFDYAVEGDNYLTGSGEIVVHLSTKPTQAMRLIIRKIEVPKKYRPFANGEEFKPHRDRWWRYAVGEEYLPQINPPIPYNELGVDGATWQQAFNGRVFDDGTPFGVEVTSE